MATYLENLRATREAYAAELALGNVKPSYSIRGQSVSWNEYRSSLLEAIKDLNELIAAADGPFEIMTEGF